MITLGEIKNNGVDFSNNSDVLEVFFSYHLESLQKNPYCLYFNAKFENFKSFQALNKRVKPL